MLEVGSKCAALRTNCVPQKEREALLCPYHRRLKQMQKGTSMQEMKEKVAAYCSYTVDMDGEKE